MNRSCSTRRSPRMILATAWRRLSKRITPNTPPTKANPCSIPSMKAAWVWEG
jgi:hypothetical protein